MPKIKYESLNVNLIQNSSGIFYGVNVQYRWNHKARMSEGFGKVHGNGNQISHNTSVLKSTQKPGY